MNTFFSTPQMQPHAPAFGRIAEALAILNEITEGTELSFIVEIYDSEETMLDHILIEKRTPKAEQVKLDSKDDDPDGIPF